MMSDWKHFENEQTSDLIQIIKWKHEKDFAKDAEAAFTALCFRFRSDLISKCEVISNRHQYDIDFAKELANRVFRKFWLNPNYDDEKRKYAKNCDDGLKFYLYAIARNELINMFRESINPSPYTGNEEIIWDFPEIDFDSMQPERRKELLEKGKLLKGLLWSKQ
ncbi:MAG: hypothetical protein U5L09_16845 [Bacteroidales bacterium]|nr:hypothetical protein [Bacteroidales bacterium]